MQCSSPRLFCLDNSRVYNQNCLVSVSISVQDVIVALGKAHMRSAPSLGSLSKVALKTVPIFAWLNTDLLDLGGWNVGASFLHSSFLQAISAVMLWSVMLRKFLGAVCLKIMQRSFYLLLGLVLKYLHYIHVIVDNRYNDSITLK